MVNLRITNSELNIRDPEGNYVLIESPAPRNFAFENGANQESVPLLFNGDTASVEELHPGEQLRLEFVTIFPEMEDESARFNLVERSIVTNLDGNVTIPTFVGPSLVENPGKQPPITLQPICWRYSARGMRYRNNWGRNTPVTICNN